MCLLSVRTAPSFVLLTYKEYIKILFLASSPYHNPTITTSHCVQISTVLGLQLCWDLDNVFMFCPIEHQLKFIIRKIYIYCFSLSLFSLSHTNLCLPLIALHSLLVYIQYIYEVPKHPSCCNLVTVCLGWYIDHIPVSPATQVT